MRIGYVRVSRETQDGSLQEDALKKAGCERVFSDKMTGAKFEGRKGLQQAIDFARPGDILVVWKLDRLGRSLIDLIKTVNFLKEREIGFISLTEEMNTSTPGGNLIFHIMGALAQFERDLIRERTRAGLDAARARGRKGGRAYKLTGKKRDIALKMFEDKSNSANDICAAVGISRSTLYRYVREAEAKK